MEEEKDVRFIAFLDENNKQVNGYFEVVLDALTFLKIKTNDNKTILTIPWHRILKIKEKIGDGDGNK